MFPFLSMNLPVLRMLAAHVQLGYQDVVVMSQQPFIA